ncbi:MAG: nuclear transport factor 2 family protein [Deltaproteobacteria bacterium]|nr:nuclear transport factor 2 family protein [Deltaproteobacteria bacterium]
MKSDESRDFATFLRDREAAARAYVRGDAGPLRQLATRTDPATFFGPRGGHEAGAEKVDARYSRDAESFTAGSKTHFEVLHQGASGDLGYWVGYQHASVHLRGKDDPVSMRLRVTEVFRHEDGAWKLIHRHADAAEEPTR